MQYAQQRSPGSNAIGIGLVVALHLGVGYALLQAMGTLSIRPAAQPLIVHPVDEPKKQEVEIQQTFDVHTEQQKTIFIRMPDLIVQAKTDAKPPTGASTELPHDTTVGPTVVATAAAIADTMAGAKRLAGPPLIYPARLQTMGVEGSVDIQCDVDDMGSTSNCAMIEHQGAMAFVEEALDYVRATRYSPATRNGVPIAEKNHRFHIVFKLSDK